MLTGRDRLLVQMEARAMVDGGLRCTDHELLDARVQWLLRSGPLMDLDRAEVARLAVAAIRGHVATHPAPTPAERAYAEAQRLRHRGNRLRRSERRLAWAVREARRFADNIKAALRAIEEFAHTVQNPVDDARKAHTPCLHDPRPMLQESAR